MWEFRGLLSAVFSGKAIGITGISLLLDDSVSFGIIALGTTFTFDDQFILVLH
jgi:hypothetical protein